MPPEADPAPSDKQLEVLKYIIEHVEEHGYQPTQAEMAAKFGVTKSAIGSRIKELARRGLVEVRPGNKERAIVLPHVEFKAILADEKK